MNNYFKNKTDEELKMLYEQWIDFENKPINGIQGKELSEIRDDMEKTHGKNILLLLQVELTHEIADRWIRMIQ